MKLYNIHWIQDKKYIIRDTSRWTSDGNPRYVFASRVTDKAIFFTYLNDEGEMTTRTRILLKSDFGFFGDWELIEVID